MKPTSNCSVEKPVVGFGKKRALTPAGKPLALRLTEPLKPPEGVMLTRYVALLSYGTV